MILSFNDDRSAILQRRFELDCVEMSLERQGRNTDHCKGAGFLRLGEDGHLRFRLYPHNQHEAPRPARNFCAGKIISTEELYTLNGRDMKGRLWVARNVYPEYNRSPSGSLVFGDLSLIQYSERHSYKHASTVVNLYAAHPFDFPNNVGTDTIVRRKGEDICHRSTLDVAEIHSGRQQIRIESVEPEGTVVTVQDPDDSSAIWLRDRLTEALNFVRGTITSWIVMEMQEDDCDTVYVRGGTGKKAATPEASPPVNTHLYGYRQDVYDLLSAYFQYVLGHRTTGYHPLSNILYSMIDANSLAMESRVLPLCVAVEGMAGLFPGYTDASASNAERERIAVAIEQSLASQGMKERAKGAIQNISQPRAVDLLMALVKKGVIREELVRRWKRLRNRTVHANMVADMPLQQLLNEMDAVRTLIHELVFLLIGYKGRYTDYSVEGWPDRQAAAFNEE
ncbi:MAG: hypothetical protein BWX88_03588 [Planctomycetes bacterium ADurb.Bin126]|nr:MAG: hypothetical protein BWX88_03588 [Planctomycetes bacterium ADurb.Bin126]HQL73851.1 hypothetical protein [Phycisphaerae bacterium]